MPMYTDILQELRKEKKLFQKDIAKKFHISRGMYGHYETGRTPMPPEMLSALADLFGVPVDYILGRTEERVPYPPRKPLEWPEE